MSPLRHTCNVQVIADHSLRMTHKCAKSSESSFQPHDRTELRSITTIFDAHHAMLLHTTNLLFACCSGRRWRLRAKMLLTCLLLTDHAMEIRV